MLMDPLCVSNAQSFSVAEEDPRPSSTSVVATLRHSPRLLLRKKTSSNSAKEPQSPDIFARGPGPALRPSTRLQTRISRMSARAKKTPSITLTTSVEVTSASAATESGLSNSATISVAASSVQYGPPNQSSASSTASSTSSPSPSYVSDAMDVFQPSITATSTTGRLTRSTLHQLQHGLHRLPNPSNTSEGYSPELHERPSRVATRNTSQSRERESSGRPGTRSRARSRLTSSNKPHSPMSSASEAGSGRGSRKDTVQALLHISRERPGSADNKEAVDDEDADDDDDDHFSSQRVLRASARTRRRAYKSSTTEGGVDREARTVPEAGTRLRLTRSRHSRHYGQAGHLREQTKQDYNDEHIRLSKVKQSCAGAVRSVGAIADNGQSVGALAEQQKNRRAQDTDRQVPNLHPATRSVRARSTKVARMGIDDYGEEEEEEDDDEVAADEDDEQEADGEDEDADYDQCPKSDPDEEGLLSRQGQFKQRISQPKRSSQQQQLPYPPSTPPQPPSTPSQQLQQQSQQNVFANLPCAQDTQATLDGFITSKPESPAAHVAVNPANQNLSHYKRKVEEDEEMEDAPISADEGQLVSTKLARIDESDGQERSAYMRSLCSILKSPREEYDGILSSESEDADLESEDDEDDFEEIDVWEFIATLPPLGPLPPNFVSTMPDKSPDTPPITLVLDIDETLVHCATRPLESPDIIFPVEYNQETWEVYGRIRPGMLEFLEKMSTKFEVITFTASQECYAEALLKIIDPEKKFIKYRYYRDSCVPVFGNYVKDLRILNRDLAKVVIIDNSPQAFGYQLSNGIPIESWYEDKSDRELAKVTEFLETLDGVDDVRPKIDEHFRLSERIQKALAAASHHQTNSLADLEFGSRLPSSTSMSSVAGAEGPTAVGTITTTTTTSTNLVDASIHGATATDILLSGAGLSACGLHQHALTGFADLDPRVLFAENGLMQIDQEPVTIEGPDGVLTFAAAAASSSSLSTSETATITGMAVQMADGATSTTTTMTIKTRSNSLEAAHNLARITL